MKTGPTNKIQKGPGGPKICRSIKITTPGVCKLHNGRHICCLVWVSIVIEMACPEGSGTGWRGAFDTFMLSRPTLSCSHWLEILYTECSHDIILSVHHNIKARNLWRSKPSQGTFFGHIYFQYRFFFPTKDDAKPEKFNSRRHTYWTTRYIKYVYEALFIVQARSLSPRWSME